MRAFILCAMSAWTAHAVDAPSAAASLTAHDSIPKALVERASRIVTSLRLEDATKADRVTRIIARQYAELGPIHDARAEALAAARQITDVSARDAATRQARESAGAQLADLTAAFLGRLAAELDPAQIDVIKDGMTYGVLPNTFRVYQEIHPDLTPEQSRQIHAWLYEAREHAISAGSSEEKHAWFGKYKGRINNYLAAAGYDAKQAEKEWLERRKAAQRTADSK